MARMLHIFSGYLCHSLLRLESTAAGVSPQVLMDKSQSFCLFTEPFFKDYAGRPPLRSGYTSWQGHSTYMTAGTSRQYADARLNWTTVHAHWTTVHAHFAEMYLNVAPIKSRQHDPISWYSVPNGFFSCLAGFLRFHGELKGFPVFGPGFLSSISSHLFKSPSELRPCVALCP